MAESKKSKVRYMRSKYTVAISKIGITENLIFRGRNITKTWKDVGEGWMSQEQCSWYEENLPRELADAIDNGNIYDIQGVLDYLDGQEDCE